MPITLDKKLQQQLAKGKTFTILDFAKKIGHDPSSVRRGYKRAFGENPGRGIELDAAAAQRIADNLHAGRGCPKFAEPDSAVMVKARKKRIRTMLAKPKPEKPVEEKRPVGRPRNPPQKARPAKSKR